VIVPHLLAISPGGLGADLDAWLALAQRVPGAGVLLREPDLPASELRRLAASAMKWAPAVVLHAKNPAARELADELGLFVHGPGGDGVSCHDADEVDAAFGAGAAYALLSPVWRPTSKPDDAREPLGPERFLAIARERPVLALGGVTPERHTWLRSRGAWGSAVLGGLAAFAAGKTPI
jgi:hypothetical protein